MEGTGVVVLDNFCWSQKHLSVGPTDSLRSVTHFLTISCPTSLAGKHRQHTCMHAMQSSRELNTRLKKYQDQLACFFWIAFRGASRLTQIGRQVLAAKLTEHGCEGGVACMISRHFNFDRGMHGRSLHRGIPRQHPALAPVRYHLLRKNSKAVEIGSAMPRRARIARICADSEDVQSFRGRHGMPRCRPRAMGQHRTLAECDEFRVWRHRGIIGGHGSDFVCATGSDMLWMATPPREPQDHRNPLKLPWWNAQSGSSRHPLARIRPPRGFRGSQRTGPRGTGAVSPRARNPGADDLLQRSCRLDAAADGIGQSPGGRAGPTALCCSCDTCSVRSTGARSRPPATRC